MSKLKYKKINISCSSMKRLRCKYCGSTNKLYSDFFDGGLYKFPQKFRNFMPTKYPILFADKKVYIDNTHKLDSKSHNISKSKNKNKSPLKEQLYCADCMMSKFSIKEKSANDPVIINRRGRYSYPDRVIA